MMNYKIDFVNNTLTMSKSFEDALNNPRLRGIQAVEAAPRRLSRPDHYPQDPPRPQEGPPQQEPDLLAHGAVHERV